jgi:hypothetical protein
MSCSRIIRMNFLAGHETPEITMDEVDETFAAPVPTTNDDPEGPGPFSPGWPRGSELKPAQSAGIEQWLP